MQLPTNHFSSSQPVSSTTFTLTSVRRSFTLLSWTCYHQLKKFLGWSYSCKDDSETWMCASEIITCYNWKLVLELTGISVLIKIKNYQRCMTNTRCGRDNVKEVTTKSRKGKVMDWCRRDGGHPGPHSNPNCCHLPSHSHKTFLRHLSAFPCVPSQTSCPSSNFLQEDSKLSRLEKLASLGLVSVNWHTLCNIKTINIYIFCKDFFR